MIFVLKPPATHPFSRDLIKNLLKSHCILLFITQFSKEEHLDDDDDDYDYDNDFNDNDDDDVHIALYYSI
jgi:hypothetical protein